MANKNGGKLSNAQMAAHHASAVTRITNRFIRLLEDKTYMDNFFKRAQYGALAPALEIMLYHYVLGKPSDNINLNINDEREDLSKLSDIQLNERVFQLQAKAEKIKDLGENIKSRQQQGLN